MVNIQFIQRVKTTFICLVNSKICTEKVPSNQQHLRWCKSDLNWGSLDIWICQCDLLSVCWCFFVLRIWQCEKVFKLPLQGFERRSLHWVLVPALQHNVVEGWRTARRTLHPVAVFHLVQDLGVGHSCKEKHERFKSSFMILAETAPFFSICFMFSY